jgi:hypothetical protein
MWKDKFAKSTKYNLLGKYDVKNEEGSYYVFIPTNKAEQGFTPIYVPADDLNQVDGTFAEEHSVKKGGGRKMTKKAKRRANSTRRR